MADGDGIGRPVLFALRTAGDEAEIDQSDFGLFKMAGEVGPESGMEAPAMDEDEMHLSGSHGSRPGACVLRREDLEQAVDVGLLMRRGEGQSQPRRAGRHGRRPDR